jgi:asparagine synthase (glutamine-hydrolysing)
MARQEVTVALTGDGGDELFAGYDRYAVHLDREKYEVFPSWLGNAFREYVYPWLPAQSRGRRLLFNLSLFPADRYIDAVSYLPGLGRERGFFSGDFLAEVNGCDPAGQFRDYFVRAGDADRISRLMYLDTKTYLPGDVLTKVDRMSMATSLEVRSPFLDHQFVEWVASLSSRWKLRDGVRKYALRKLALRVGIPASVLDRPKKGFALPLTHWWRGELKQDLLSILLEPRTLQRGYFNPHAVRQLLDEHWSGRRNRPTDIWLLLVFELWQRNFLEVLTGSSATAFPYPEKCTSSPAGRA